MDLENSDLASGLMFVWIHIGVIVRWGLAGGIGVTVGMHWKNKTLSPFPLSLLIPFASWPSAMVFFLTLGPKQRIHPGVP